MRIGTFCPVCQSQMETRELGVRRRYWQCFDHGILVHLDFFRWFKGAAHITTELKSARSRVINNSDKKLICPACRAAMAVTEAKIGTTLHVDQCLRCNHVWFDVGELEKIPVKGDLESHFPRAQLRSDQLGQDAVYNSKPKPSNRDMLEVDVHSFGLIGALGLPAEQDHVGVKVFPAGTVALVMACFGATARALHSSEFMAKYSYVAQEPFANHGYSFFISALIHADYKHFLGNMYFLSIFGDNIEDQDGPWVLFTIFWLSVAAGHLLTSYFDVPTPSIGASGGISGLLSYYALMFPHNRMRLTFFRFMPTSFLNVNISIGFWFIQWLLFQMVGATGMYFHSHSEVNFYAHVGGALAGVLFYLYRSDQLPAD